MKEVENKIIYVHGKNCNYMKTNLNETDLNKTNCLSTCRVLDSKQNAKYLGLMIDSNWNFKLHIKSLINKLRQILSKLYRLRTILNEKNKKIIYTAWIESLLRYGIELYGFATDYLINRLQSLQNKIVKMLFGNKIDKTAKIFKDKEILTVLQLRDQIVIINNYFTNKHKKCNSEKLKRLRQHKHRFTMPRWFNKYGQRNKNYYIPKIFNRLDNNLLSFNSIRSLKPELKKFLINEN